MKAIFPFKDISAIWLSASCLLISKSLFWIFHFVLCLRNIDRVITMLCDLSNAANAMNTWKCVLCYRGKIRTKHPWTQPISHTCCICLGLFRPLLVSTVQARYEYEQWDVLDRPQVMCCSLLADTLGPYLARLDGLTKHLSPLGEKSWSKINGRPNILF